MSQWCPNDCDSGRLMVIKGWPGNGPMNEPEPAICEACDIGKRLTEDERLSAHGENLCVACGVGDARTDREYGELCESCRIRRDTPALDRIRNLRHGGPA
jgi:hypothetical protein